MSRKKQNSYSTSQAVAKPRRNRRAKHSPENIYSTPGVRPNDASFSELFGGFQESTSGIRVNETLALNWSAVKCAVELIASTLAAMPIEIIRTDKNNPRKKEIVTDHPANRILSVSPDDQIPSMLWRESMTAHALITGNGCSELIRNGRLQAHSMHLIDPQRVRPQLDPRTGVKFYRVGSTHGADDVPNDRMFHVPALTWNGVEGMSPVKQALETIGLALAAEKMGSQYFGKGGRPLGFLTKPTIIPEEQRKQYRKEWDEMHGGLENAMSVGILSGGLAWQNIGFTPEEAQFMGLRAFQIEEIARWFKIPPHMLGQVAKAGASSMEQLTLEFATFCLLPWIKRWEGELNMKLFTRVEQFTYRARFNMAGVLRADSKTRTEVLAKQLANGIITINEWRELEDRNAYSDCGDEPMVMASQLATVKQVEKGLNRNSPIKDLKEDPTKTGKDQNPDKNPDAPDVKQDD